jgi:lipopolysaccharide/colanic/teichoic acid biosynthesis glycosyltransferase
LTWDLVIASPISARLLDVKVRPLADWGPLLKKAEDYALGTVLLLLSLPLMAIIAILTKLDSRGPVFVSENRRGLDARVLKVWRFRSTHVDLDGRVIEVAADAPKHDANITRLGRALRATGLEKLPQLFNVIMGDMSLVGPAPYALAEPCRHGQMLEDHANRYRVKPGMTGASRSASMDETESSEHRRARVESEMADISHWTLGRDFHRLAQAMFGRGR